MLLSHNQLLGLVSHGVIIGSQPERVNSSSIDVTLGRDLLIEINPLESRTFTMPEMCPILSLRDRDTLIHEIIHLEDGESYIMQPGQFLLAHTVESFNLPPYISAQFKMSSSVARMGLEQLGADWCSAGWKGSKLTLELKNMTQHHAIEIRPGDKIGQMVFYRHEAVSEDYLYRGSYNNDTSVSATKGKV